MVLGVPALPAMRSAMATPAVRMLTNGTGSTGCADAPRSWRAGDLWPARGGGAGEGDSAAACPSRSVRVPAGAAGREAAAPTPRFGSIWATIVPTRRSLPRPPDLCQAPADGDGISASTLSVEISRIASRVSTGSPTSFQPTWNRALGDEDSPIWGIGTSIRDTGTAPCAGLAPGACGAPSGPPVAPAISKLQDNAPRSPHPSRREGNSPPTHR